MTRALVAVVLASAALSWSGVQTSAPPTGAISGRVVDQDSTSVPGAVVRITGRSETTSDGKGQFAFSALPPDAFELTASKALYASAPGIRVPPSWPTVRLADGGRVTDVVLHLWRGAVIEGMVVDDDGDPVPDVRVTVLKPEITGSSSVVRTETTDAMGRYRVTGLAPGDYIIAGSRDVYVDHLHYRGADGVERVGAFADVFYASTTDRTSAATVSVTYGDVRSGVDLRMMMVPATRIEGTIAAIDGRPLTSMSARLSLPSTAIGSYPNSMIFPRDGRFRFGHITAGSYVIVARGRVPGQPDQGTGDGPPQDGYWALERVTTDGRQPVTISMSLERGANLAGRIVIEGAPPPPNRPVIVEIHPADPADPYSYIMDSLVTHRSDASGGTSWTGLPPGEYVFTLSSSPDAGRWIKSVMIGARDISDEPLSLRLRQDLVDLTITIGDRASELSCRVLDAIGKPVVGASVAVYTTDPRYLLPGRRGRIGQTSADGRFVLRGLAPGEYFVLPLPSGTTGPWLDRARLAPLQALATRVIIGEGQTTTVDVKAVR